MENRIKPSYYGSQIDVIEFVQANNLDFMQGNVIKYITRYKSKNGIEDLYKAKEYIDRIIQKEIDLQKMADDENLKLMIDVEMEENLKWQIMK